jgi:hypothetical protein
MPDPYLSFERQAYFPNLRRPEYRVTSDETPVYNCIAHAAGKNDKWWWPADAEGAYWPSGIDKKETIDGFILAYQTEGYVVCEGRELETGFDKIAIYVDELGTPTHAARQLSDGSWCSKLGQWEDIQHQTLEALETGEDENYQGLAYGKVALIMRRPSP